MYNFRSLCNKFPKIFWLLIFHIWQISLPRWGCFSYKFSDSKMRWREDWKNSHFRNSLNCISNFGENSTEVLASLRMHLSRSKSTLESLKNDFNVFRRKTSLGALVFSFQCIIMPCQKHITLSRIHLWFCLNNTLHKITHTIVIIGVMSRAYLWSILCWSHYLVSLFIYKILSYIYQEDMKQLISKGSIKHNIFLVSFAGIALKLEKVGPTFSRFNPFPSLPSVTKDNRKQFQCLNTVLNNKTESLFLKFNWCEKSLSFLKNADSVIKLL